MSRGMRMESVRLANRARVGQPLTVAMRRIDSYNDCRSSLSLPSRLSRRFAALVRDDTSEVMVEFSVIGLNVLYAIIGVVIMFVSYRVIDRLTPEVDFPAELQKGNVAVAIFIAAIFISIAMIIGKALG